MLVFLGTLARKGFPTMVEYTAPVFWCFFFTNRFIAPCVAHQGTGADLPLSGSSLSLHSIFLLHDLRLHVPSKCGLHRRWSACGFGGIDCRSAPFVDDPGWA